jgi:2-keto-3-deoxy-L-rhamnonate aldolase RhmA
MALLLMYITNNPEIALVAEKHGINRIWIDLETHGKEERQKNMNTVKSKHKVEDIGVIKQLLTKAEILVRVNPWNENSWKEIDSVVEAGADIIMLPMWTCVEEVQNFLVAVGGRTKTTLLLETKEAVECINTVIQLPGIDEIHVGLNDLHLSFGMTFMFELLSNGTVEMLCNRFKAAGIPYGFGGIAKIGEGMLPAEKIVLEHYRLGSTRAILSRTFCNNAEIDNINEIDRVLDINVKVLREFEEYAANVGLSVYQANKVEVVECVNKVVSAMKEIK